MVLVLQQEHVRGHQRGLQQPGVRLEPSTIERRMNSIVLDELFFSERICLERIWLEHICLERICSERICFEHSLMHVISTLRTYTGCQLVNVGLNRRIRGPGMASGRAVMARSPDSATNNIIVGLNLSIDFNIVGEAISEMQYIEGSPRTNHVPPLTRTPIEGFPRECEDTRLALHDEREDSGAT